MLSIVIPTYNSAMSLKKTIASLVPPPYAREIIVVDGGSSDATLKIAQELADRIVTAPKGRGAQLKAGAEAASGDWLLFLHSDTHLPDHWGAEVASFIAGQSSDVRAGYFTFALDEEHEKAKRLEKIVSWRCRLLGLPYGDQGLLISRDHYDQVGGFSDIPLMEDVDMVRRIGKKHLKQLSVKAVTSAVKYQKEGYLRRMMRNATCLTLYFLGLSPQRILKIYE
ncbi:putative Glycosyl transferase, group 2 family protein [Candidatus Terasakiella magnetica]|uniref:Putative Glycosyl transferase, group 2 family protein n=1 Tax=Candidatus Terasakiella magnetica TaxID=1867952 RepID=A0A1C3RJ45_9PROT|nr:TIGR04283 family arsenosugar biosynthesis glycosyltransferase [Candidatus Terasakiella magnetica]SCA57281.1 putative Glycosyl transferase, group 2 family protein [Candidatus Terasakiella magnetica]